MRGLQAVEHGNAGATIARPSRSSMTNTAVNDSNTTTDPATLKKAALRAAEVLGLSQQLPSILGIDTESWQAHERALTPGTEQWNAAVRFVSLFRSLLTLVGSVSSAREWLDQRHRTLGESPRVLLQNPAGLERVVRYLDAVQKFEVKLPPRSEPS
jgi:hypothetical protein